MKTLILVRHAKSSWDVDDIDDFDRPLNQRGLRDSVTMGERLLAREHLPQYIVSSPALRALTTAKRLATAMRLGEHAISTDVGIYEADTDALYDCLWAVDERFEHIMLVGHNPGISDFAQSLLTTPIAPFVTCAMAIIEFSCSKWCEVIPSSGVLLSSDFPKNISA